jgi:hypothetical protein
MTGLISRRIGFLKAAGGKQIYMKERLLKWGLALFLAAVLVVPGLLASVPVISQAAGGTTYNVVLQKGSPVVTLNSLNGSAASASLAQDDGATFQMVVGAKAGKDKSGTYYPVTIIAKSYKAPTQEFPFVGGGGMAVRSSLIAKDAVGKLYTNGGAVDVTSRCQWHLAYSSPLCLGISAKLCRLEPAGTPTSTSGTWPGNSLTKCDTSLSELCSRWTAPASWVVTPVS